MIQKLSTEIIPPWGTCFNSNIKGINYRNQNPYTIDPTYDVISKSPQRTFLLFTMLLQKTPREWVIWLLITCLSVSASDSIKLQTQLTLKQLPYRTWTLPSQSLLSRRWKGKYLLRATSYAQFCFDVKWHYFPTIRCPVALRCRVITSCC